MEETVKQVIYRSFMDNTYAKRISSLPLTEDYFSKEVIPIVKVINSHYRKEDTPISGEAINLDLEKSLSDNKIIVKKILKKLWVKFLIYLCYQPIKIIIMTSQLKRIQILG